MTNMHHSICIQVHANGVVSFNGPLGPVTPQFPVANRFVLAPFWTEPGGLTATIEYELFNINTAGTASNYLMLVNNYIMTQFNTTFNGSLLVIMRWSNIGYPNTESVSPIVLIIDLTVDVLFADKQQLISDNYRDRP